MAKLSDGIIASAVDVAGDWTLAVIEHRKSENFTETAFLELFKSHFEEVLASVEVVLTKHTSP